MLSARLLTEVIRAISRKYLKLEPISLKRICGPEPGKHYMLYMHVPFCEQLCPYCSFNRFPFEQNRAETYFANLRREMLMLKEIGYDFDSLYVGGGTPTILIDELCETIDLAKETFSIKEVSCETNPNHLTTSNLDKLQGRVQRMSVGVQSFDDDLLKQMGRYDKYGSSDEIVERIGLASPYFISLNADMIFNFPSQSEDILIRDIERAALCGANQVTFYPLMASSSVVNSLMRTVGMVDYTREQRYYEIICEILTGGSNPLFDFSSAWTFNRRAPEDTQGEDRGMIDEYVIDYEEYPAIGSGGITYLGDRLYANTFSVNDYNAAIEADRMSVMGTISFSKRDRMRYRFLTQLFGLRLDKRQFARDFGCTVEQGLPLEMAFMRVAGAFERDTADELTLTPRGRYLAVVMMRQFFVGVNNLRDQARAALPGEERELLFSSIPHWDE